MDPFSITASIVTLIQVSAQVTVLVKQFRDEVSVVDTTLNGILIDVDGFQQVLQSMKETFAQEDIQADVRTTGHVGSHWKNLARSLSDGEGTLDQLRSLLTSVNKSSSFLDAPRKQLRLKSALTQISGFREQIQSYRAAMQLSLSTVIVWNQVTLQKSTVKLPEEITPNLNKLYDEIHKLGASLNAKIGKLESTVANQGFHAESELLSMSNLKECVESAADVVSTASTTLGPEGSEKASVKYGSDFGDVFKQQSKSETMQRWISSNTVYEFDGVEAPSLDPSETSTGDALTVYESDSDSDIENELVRALFNNGKKRKEQGDLHGAERHLRNCLSRFPATTSYTSLTSSQSTSITGVSKAELLDLLTETYCLQASWSQAKLTMKEKLAITECQTGKRSERFLWDSFKLCKILMNAKDYTEAHLHGRQSLRGFRKLRKPGHDGYAETLALLIQICNEHGSLEDEEAYAALLDNHQASLKGQQSAPGDESNTTEDPASPLVTANPQASESEGTLERVFEDRFLSKSQRISGKPTSPERGERPLGKGKQPAVFMTRNRTDYSSTPSPPLVLGDVSTEISKVGGELSVERTATQESVESDLVKPPSTSRGKQARLEKLTPTPPQATPDNTLSRSSSVDVEPWSPSTQASQSRTKTPTSEELLPSVVQKASFLKSTDVTLKATTPHQSTLSIATNTDNGNTSTYTKLLVALCQQELGEKPVFMIGRGREGYNCIVFADEFQEQEIAKVIGCKTREEARHTAASKAYKALVSLSTQSEQRDPLHNIPDKKAKDRLLDPESDKKVCVAPREAYVDPLAYTPTKDPSNLTSPVGLLQDVPEIMVSPTLDDTMFIRAVPNDSGQYAPVRRAASDSRLPWQRSSSAKSSVESSQTPNETGADLALSAHRRAASTSTRLPEWKTQDKNARMQSPESAMTTSPTQGLHALESNLRRSNATPNVTFDSIEGSIERPSHSNSDSVTPSPRSFSLFPASIVKTFSLQDRRNKSDDHNVKKKKSLRFGLLSSSSRRKSSTSAFPESGIADLSEASFSTNACPLCAVGLQGLSDDEAWSHVDSCLNQTSSRGIDTVFELPASEPSFFAAELPAPSTPPTPSRHQMKGPTSPSSSNRSSSALSELHRAFSRRDLSADKFEIGNGAATTPLTPMSPLSRFEMNPLQRQVLLLGDTQCGKTWLSSAWCNGTIPKHTSPSATTFTKQMSNLDIVIQDCSALDFMHEHMRRASYGIVHAVLLCFDISSPESFDNIEHKWNQEADLYRHKVPKILVGCKKDINRGGSQAVWAREAYKLTARINARAYFETSAVTMEGLDVLFSHVAQIAPR